MNHLRAGLEKYFSNAQLATLASLTVGIAGAGGLGSNIAMMLARSGIEKMRILDHDIVDASNLNRQNFWPRHLGKPKVFALGELLRDLNPDIQLDCRNILVENANLDDLLSGYDIWVEALDEGAAKAMFVERALLAGKYVVAASGICGIGGSPMRKRRLGALAIAGDFQTGLDREAPYAPRVMQAAALMADCVLEYALKRKTQENSETGNGPASNADNKTSTAKP